VTLWNIVQAVQIKNLSNRAVLSDTQAEAHRGAARRDSEALADDLDRLRLVTEALWSFVGERLGVTEQELVARIQAIDLADGVADGRSTARPRPCPSCRAMVPADRAACQFCGAATPGQRAFD
jgi:hypothetical protein